MKRAPRSRQRHDLYAKYHDYDSEISDLLGECGCVNNRFSDDEVKPAELVYDGADPGIDGAMLYVDGRLILSEEELIEMLSAGKRELEFEIVFTQVKTSESWSKKEIDTFSAAIVDLLSEQPAQPLSDYLKEFKKIFNSIFSNIKRVKGGLPTASAFFVSAASDTNAAEINAAVIVGHKQLEGTAFFREIDFRKVPREVLHEWWLACGAADESTLPVFNYSPFPSAPNVKSAYVATVSAKSFIERVLKNPDGTRRKKLFEMNVRDFLGESEEVNSEISETLNDNMRKSRFGLMNNGVTIVAESVRPAGQEIFIGNYQIVNGCQTSNVLLSNEAAVDETVSLMVKFIESSDGETIEDIVRATNRQSKVEDEQFASTMESLRALEEYFVARGFEQQNKIVFERRRGQYRAEGIPQARIVDVRELARAIASTRLQRPDLASRFVSRLTGEMRDDIFKAGAGDELAYLSCFANYRLRIFISNKKFDPKYSKLRWHILCATWRVCSDHYKRFDCKSPEKAFERLYVGADDMWNERLAAIVQAALPNPDVSRDVLKGQAFTGDMLKGLAAADIK